MPWCTQCFRFISYEEQKSHRNHLFYGEKKNKPKKK